MQVFWYIDTEHITNLHLIMILLATYVQESRSL